jgi:matrixin
MHRIERAALCGVTLVGLVASRAQAFEVLDSQWADKSREFRINLESFDDNLNDIPTLTEAEAKYWISFAMQNWRQRTSASITLDYQGTTTRKLTSTCKEITGNGVNEIYMYPGNYDDDVNSGILGISQRYASSDVTITVEDDVCFYADAAPGGWRLKTSDFVQNNTFSDLVTTMGHEFGHFFGLEHSGNPTVLMKPLSSGVDGTMFRFPFGDDIDGIQSSGLPYGGTSRLIYSRAISTAAWGAETATTFGAAATMAGATLAKRDASNFGVTLALAGSNGIIFFARYGYPITTSTTKSYPAYTTRRSPSIAGRTTGASKHVAVWTETKADWVCHPLRVGMTTNNFDTMVVAPLNSDCTVQDPAVVYDPNSDRFVLFYVQQAITTGTRHLNDLIKYRTSTDGTTWTAAQSWGTGIKTIAGVTGACSDSQNECMLTYVPGDSQLPAGVMSSFTVSAGGTITITGTTTPATWGNSCREWANTAGVYNRNGSATWFAETSSSSQPGCRFADDGMVTYYESNNIMTAPSAFVISGALTRKRPSFAMADTASTTTGYIFYAKE